MFIHAPNKLGPLPRLGATGQRLREHNEAILLRLVWEAEQGVSRADLARRTGLSRSTVSAITADLIDKDLVVEHRRARSKGGRPPILLCFTDRRFALVGVEIGSAHVSCVRTDMRGRLESHVSEPWPVQQDPEGTLELVGRVVQQALGDLWDHRVPVGLGLAVPCPLDRHHPGRLSSRILPRWAGVDPAQWLYERFRLPVLVDNDANLGALAESWWGDGRGVDHFTFVKVATGVGAGHMIEGETFRGASGIAGEIGHSMVLPTGRACRCGLTGCLEAEVGSVALLEKAAELLDNGAASPLARIDPLTLEGLVEVARGGDPVATEIIAEAGHLLGIALANLVNLMNPARVILGGRVTQAGDLLVRPLRRAMAERALASNVEGAEVRISQLAPGPIARGAATLVLQWALDDARVLTGSASSDSRASTRLLDPQPSLR